MYRFRSSASPSLAAATAAATTFTSCVGADEKASSSCALCAPRRPRAPSAVTSMLVITKACWFRGSNCARTSSVWSRFYAGVVARHNPPMHNFNLTRSFGKAATSLACTVRLAGVLHSLCVSPARVVCLVPSRFSRPVGAPRGQGRLEDALWGLQCSCCYARRQWQAADMRRSRANKVDGAVLVNLGLVAQTFLRGFLCVDMISVPALL